MVTNGDLPAELGTSDHWIRTRTGITRRHYAAPGSATSDLAVEAGARALASSGEPKVDAVVLATTTPDRICPATAPEIATRLGLTGAAAFDMNAACTGFLYGLACAAGLIATGVADRVLLIGAETYSGILDPRDRGTAPIFGDGAGAVVLRAGTPTSRARWVTSIWAATATAQDSSRSTAAVPGSGCPAGRSWRASGI